MKKAIVGLVGLVLSATPALAWQVGWKYSVVVCREDIITSEVSQTYGANETTSQGWKDCEAALYKRTHRADGSVRRNVFVVADCMPNKAPDIRGFHFTAKVSYEDEAETTVKNSFFIRQETCFVALDRLMSIEDAHEGITVDVIDACVPN